MLDESAPPNYDHGTVAPPPKSFGPGPRGAPPGSYEPARRLARRALAPVERFLAIEAASGILLLFAAAVALLWANSPWRESYAALWHTHVGFSAGPVAFERSLHFWINDGLMTIFFFVVGLEIRREIHRGELSQPRRAALPLAAALGGMLVPAALFLAFNAGRSTASGWGIPMATDIAFAVGVLTLLGKRVPPGMRVLLLSLAVIDDVGAILVIALFYSSGFSAAGFAFMGAGVAAVLAMQALGVRRPWLYVPAGVLVWAGSYAAGIHPTLAGVVVGLLTPVRAWFGRRGFVEHAGASVEAVRTSDEAADDDADEGADAADDDALHGHLDRADRARREAVSPALRLERTLHGWVAFGVMPLFALANAGVSLGDASLSGDALWVFLGVSAGLVVGKPLGVVGASWLAARTRLATLPGGIGWPPVAVVGVVAGVGFTMSIFIAELAFPAGRELETAKAAVLVGSALSAALAYGLGRALFRGSRGPATGPAGGPPTPASAQDPPGC